MSRAINSAGECPLHVGKVVGSNPTLPTNHTKSVAAPIFLLPWMWVNVKKSEKIYWAIIRLSYIKKLWFLYAFRRLKGVPFWKFKLRTMKTTVKTESVEKTVSVGKSENTDADVIDQLDW